MAYSRFQAGVILRVTLLFLTLLAIAWVTSHTTWYVVLVMAILAAIAQVWHLNYFVTSSSRDVARFLDSVIFDDGVPTFTVSGRDGAFAELSNAMTRMLDQLRAGRRGREEQAQYLQSLISHVPVSLISVDANGKVELLNHAARRLFDGPCREAEQFSRYGATFATGLVSLQPGHTQIMRMERASGSVQLKVATTDIKMAGQTRRIFSLQNIEADLIEQEFTAWQTVIRIMAHEVSNSLTPISSLAGTGRQLLEEVMQSGETAEKVKPTLKDVQDALDTIARRSEGLQNFVHNHRRLAKRLVAETREVMLGEVLSRLQRLLSSELSAINIDLSVSVEPEGLKLSVDVDLLDQALINLVRNSIEAFHGAAGQIEVTAVATADGHVLISVADNGPGIVEPHRDKVFVPFFTTKKQGSGIGLTLVRQIAAIHGGNVAVGETPGGGATITMKF